MSESREPTSETNAPVTTAVLGGGSIGVAFAVVFLRAGFTVRIYEPQDERRDLVAQEVSTKLSALADAGLVDRITASETTTAGQLTVYPSLDETVHGADLVQECVPEDLELKRSLFTQISPLLGERAVLASSSSAITASTSTRGLPCSSQTLVAHPGNPPYLLPVIEIVPSPVTSPAITETATGIYRRAGLSPVVLAKEVEGFVFNRLQGAVLREAYALVRDGVASVESIDTVMRDGLGRRWAFMGPFETVDLNTRGGIASHAEKMGPAYERMGAERGQHDPWTPGLVDEVARQRRDLLPLDEWENRVAWRDRQLIRQTLLTAKDKP
ncbi:3-hydroxyacyl-CoA dehydrogenase [Corynebacterium sp.]|jgi:L-gulonate 3-dehydrogenase|uniref:3-hydroxyacyl-CoA dehydrogenase n=1 Tax=Corynebacterium sp. TaxID=1720 RepID=UPI0025BFAB96|nr:3-hydroxyacyl-CoA dehydrogenase [Corynebacterium sp.]